jgi:rhamnulokinase
MTAGTVAAVDLGATSGRVILGRVERGELRMRHVARFPNEPVRTRDGLHWNILELYRQVIAGLAAAEREAPGEIVSVGIDSWGCDYGLIEHGALLGIPYHYRDERTTPEVAEVHGRLSQAELYRRNGIQHLPFNTIYQLASDRRAGRLGQADRMLLIPDLLIYWLTGTEIAERTNASTTGLLRQGTAGWDTELAARLDIPERILPPLVDAGTPLEKVCDDVAVTVGCPLTVTTVGSHDTASAVVAIPSSSRDFAYVSCGTWGLAGLELDEPVLSAEAGAVNFTNEASVDGRIRFLRNVMGLWLLSESVRCWDRGATGAQRSSTLQRLLAEAAHLPGSVAVFDVNDPRFLPPGDMPSRIAAWCREHDQPEPRTPVQFVRSITDSLGQAFADAIHEASRLADRVTSVIHIVGGGAQNALLCQATADRSGIPVLAGPVEATAVGNILVQARAHGLVSGSLDTLRELTARAFPPIRYEPRDA